MTTCVQRAARWLRACSGWSLALWLLCVACSQPGSGSVSLEEPTADAAQGGSFDSGGGDVYTLDEIDLRAVKQANDACEGLTKEPLWSGWTLCSAPLILVRRSVKGSYQGALIVRPSKTQMLSLLPTDSPEVWRYHLDASPLSPAQRSRVDAPLGDSTALAVAYDAAELQPAWAWLGLLGRAAMTRHQEVEGAWTAVEGCGRQIYPRHQELIALTLLESVVLAEAVTATDAQLPELARDLHCVRSARKKLHNMVGRIDNDAENLLGSQRWAQARLPVSAGMQTKAQLRTSLATALLSVHEVALTELDDALLWKRPEVSGALWLEVASRLGWAVEDAYAEGKAAADVAGEILGAAEAERLGLIKARHGWAAMLAKADELMGL